MRSRDALVADLAACLEQVPAATFAYLFGSRARGDAREDSDVDVAVYGTPSGWALFRDCLGALGERFPTGRVHLTLLADAPPGLVYRVLRDGVPLLDRDPVARVRFAVRGMSMYQDMAHMHRLYAEADAARAGGKGGTARDG